MSDDPIPARLSFEKILEDNLADFLSLATDLPAYKGSGDTRTTTPRLDIVAESIDPRFNDEGVLVPVETPRGDEYLQHSASVRLAVVEKYEETGDRETILAAVGQVRAAMLTNSGNFAPGVFPGLTLVDVKPNGSRRETADGKHVVELSYLLDFDTDPGDWPES